MNDNHKNKHMLGVTAMAGVFPHADNIDQFWEKIVKAEVAPLTHLEDKWKVERSVYYHPKPGKSGYVYLDHAFCLPELTSLRGPQVGYASIVLRNLLKPLKASGNLPDLSRTALVLAVNWSDPGYYLGDMDMLFRRKVLSDDTRISMRYSPDERLDYIAGSAGVDGPCLSIDTACATSSYGIMTAENLISSGQADAVVVLGLNVTIPLYLMLPLSQILALAIGGKSLPFAGDASGMIPGESAAAVLLEPVHQAVASNREIYGVLRASGFSADGSEGSVLSPGFEGQMLSYKRAYKDVDPSSVDYIEAHGTATTMGDRIEINSLDTFFKPHIRNNTKLPIGSVKALVGHTIAASGMVSLIKALLIIRHRTIPPHVPVTPSPDIAPSCLCLPRASMEIAPNGRPIRIGVSSFGLGGSNSHMIIESYEPETRSVYFHKKQKTNEAAPRLAVIDLEVAFGNTVSAAAWQKCVNADTFSFQPFPYNRFESESRTPLKGLFLPEKLTIDAENFRMGPKLIPLVDSFQNLGTYLIGNLLKRHPELKNSDDTGISLCCNSGGGMQFRMARRAYGWHYAVLNRLLPLDDRHRPRAAIEEIYSMLGSMFSGFPAYHYNLRGFHQTYSGRPDLFWTTLRSAPRLLSDHCRHLFIGGGSYIKTPIDLYDPGLRKNPGNTRIVEGIGIFYTKSLAQAEADGDRILAVITAMVPGTQADNFQDACAISGIDPSDVDIQETCQLAPGMMPPATKSDSPAENWFLYEVTGIDKLTSVLLKNGKQAAIKVYSGDHLELTVFIEKRELFHQESKPMTFPIDISFVDNTIAATFQEQSVNINSYTKPGYFNA